MYDMSCIIFNDGYETFEFTRPNILQRMSKMSVVPLSYSGKGNFLKVTNLYMLNRSLYTN